MTKIDVDELGDVLGTLVRQDRLSPAAADAVLEAARRQAAAARSEQGIAGRLAEIGGYLGGALVVAALLALSASAWSDWSSAARAVVLFAVAGALGGAGAVLHEREGTPLDRLAGALWLVAVLVVAGAAGEGAQAAGVSDASTVLVGGIAALATAAALLRLRRGLMQLLALMAAMLLTVGGALAAADISDRVAAGLVFVALGLAWMLVDIAGRMRPAGTGIALGGLTAAVAAQVVTLDERWLGLLIGLTIAAAGYLLGIAGRGLVPLALGTAAVAVFAPQVAYAVAGDSLGGPTVLLMAGVIVLGATATAVVIARRQAAVTTSAAGATRW